ncbi:MAG: hypothetical protein N2C12_03140 [Planctomycetales bacterium]
MRFACALILLSAVLHANSLFADQLPYQAYVQSDQVYLHSGPGKNHYATSKLKRGQAVEVYRHEPGDWVAVRPTQSSFSWIAARHVKQQDGDIGEVIHDHAAAYIGSELSDARDTRHVYLKEGDLVEIIGERKQIELDDGSKENWYKIMPPSGEFRWMQRQNLTRNPIGSEANGSQVRPAGFQEEAENGEADDKPVVASGPGRLDLELSLIVAERRALWDFTELRARAESEIENAETPLERGKARLVLKEIKQYEKLKKRYQTASQPGKAVTPEKKQPGSENLASFDGVGRLTPVVSRRVGAPKFALTEMKGYVVMFVTPEFGVDLDPYVGKVVGLTGKRGSLPRLKKTLLLASKVRQLPPTANLATRPRRKF